MRDLESSLLIPLVTLKLVLRVRSAKVQNTRRKDSGYNMKFDKDTLRWSCFWCMQKFWRSGRTWTKAQTTMWK